MNRNTFSDKEQSCQSAFGKHRHWWHLYTLGKQTPLVFRTPQDFMFGINLLARCCDECQGITIVAFEIMSNHIHLVIAGEEEAVRNFFSHYHKRMARYFSSQGYGSIPDGFSLCLKAVPDLQSLRNVIAYVQRNGYVADPAVTPMSYPWGTGQFYFQLPRETKPASDLTYRQTREMFRTGEYKIPASFRILDGHICPASFCAIGLGMAMFRDAHHYFSAVSKSVEAYSGIAVEIDDGEFLPDQELFAKVLKIVREKYRLASTKELTGAQRLDLARTLHYDYRSSNGQIRRVLDLSQYEVDSLFPKGK